jgi:hypothetical protein
MKDYRDKAVDVYKRLPSGYEADHGLRNDGRHCMALIPPHGFYWAVKHESSDRDFVLVYHPGFNVDTTKPVESERKKILCECGYALAESGYSACLIGRYYGDCPELKAQDAEKRNKGQYFCPECRKQTHGIKG